MYFGLVLVYPALRFINDISLMNFSARNLTAAFICCNVALLRAQVLLFLVALSSFIVSIVLFAFRHPPCCVSLFCWDCKGRNLFHSVKLFV